MTSCDACGASRTLMSISCCSRPVTPRRHLFEVLLASDAAPVKPTVVAEDGGDWPHDALKCRTCRATDNETETQIIQTCQKSRSHE